ncbi:MAG: hypothetical protein ISS66_22220 [Desulfobacteraceae bacterium]|nr:hypothetical protein [Desulfobacteraceae bacterium]
MPQKLQGYVTTIVGTLITIALSLISDFILNLPSEITWLTFFVGAIVTVTVTLLEQRLLTVASEEINRKLEIYRLLDQIEDPELSQLARTAIRGCTEKLQEYANGVVTYSTHGYLTDRVGKCQKSLQATFWASDKIHLYNVENIPAGRSYYQLNEQLLKKGVRVERVFILRQADMLDDQGRFTDTKALRVIQGQQKEGVTVWISWLDNWGHYAANSDLYRDFAILDESEVLGHVYSVGNAPPRSILIKNQEKVSEYREVFAKLLKLSRSLDETLAEHPPIAN